MRGVGWQGLTGFLGLVALALPNWCHRKRPLHPWRPQIPCLPGRSFSGIGLEFSGKRWSHQRATTMSAQQGGRPLAVRWSRAQTTLGFRWR